MGVSEGTNLILVGGGREECTSEYRIERKGFPFVTVEFVLAGTWRLRRKGREELLRPGAVFGYGPTTSYSLESVGGPDRTKYFLNLTGACAEDRLREAGVAEGSVRYLTRTRWVQDLWDQVLDCGRLGAAAPEIGRRLSELLLLRLAVEGGQRPDLRTEGRQTFEKCRALIHEQYVEIGSIREVADRCHLDPAYLSRLFQRFSDERPLQMLNRLKTRHAADLILRRGYGVAEAGRLVGFADPYHFSRVFKRVHGVAPSRLGAEGLPHSPPQTSAEQP